MPPSPFLCRILPLLLLGLVSLGCRSTQTFQPSDAAIRTDINEIDDDRTAQISFTDGSVQTVTGLHVAPDVTTWIDPETREMRQRPTSEVRSIQVKNYGKGALQGLGIGVATGAVVGGLLGAATYEDEPDGSFCLVICSRSEAVIAGAFALGLVGLPVGTIAGAVRGHRDRYVLDVPTEAEMPADTTRSSALRPR